MDDVDMRAVLQRLQREVPGWGFEIDPEDGVLSGRALNQIKPRMTMVLLPTLDTADDQLGWQGHVGMDVWGTVTPGVPASDPVRAVREAGAFALVMAKRGFTPLYTTFRNVRWTSDGAPRLRECEGTCITGQLSPGHHLVVGPVNLDVAHVGNDRLQGEAEQRVGWSARLEIAHQNVSGVLRTARSRPTVVEAVSEVVYAAVQSAAISGHVRVGKEGRKVRGGGARARVSQVLESLVVGGRG